MLFDNVYPTGGLRKSDDLGAGGTKGINYDPCKLYPEDL